MAAAKRCDRCGTYYEKNTSKIVGVRTVDNTKKTKHYDLCDECSDKLTVFLNTYKEGQKDD